MNSRFPWSFIGNLDSKPWDYLEMFLIEPVKGLSDTDGDCSNETVHHANAMAEMELLEPLQGPFGIAGLEVEDGVPS